jgi:hypothetical protein
VLELSKFPKMFGNQIKERKVLEVKKVKDDCKKIKII